MNSGADVLIAHADASEAARLEKLLSGWKYAVDTVQTVGDALDRLVDRSMPILALIDSSISPSGGIDVLHRLRQSSDRNTVFLMLMTSAPSAELVSQALDAGVDELVTYPLDEVDLQVRLATAVRVQQMNNQRMAHMIKITSPSALQDVVTGSLNREAMLAMLFRETDRVQRMRTPLSYLLLAVDDFTSLTIRNGYEIGDQILQQIAERFRRYLRSYDTIGRMSEDSFLLGLPGCTMENAVALAERLGRVVFAKPFRTNRDSIKVTACFGVSYSLGRTPMVVMREAEQALELARLVGPGSVRSIVSDPPGMRLNRDFPTDEQHREQNEANGRSLPPTSQLLN